MKDVVPSVISIGLHLAIVAHSCHENLRFPNGLVTNQMEDTQILVLFERIEEDKMRFCHLQRCPTYVGWSKKIHGSSVRASDFFNVFKVADSCSP